MDTPSIREEELDEPTLRASLRFNAGFRDPCRRDADHVLVRHRRLARTTARERTRSDPRTCGNRNRHLRRVDRQRIRLGFSWR